MLIKARHRNAREKIKFLKLVAFDDVIGFHVLIMGFIWFGLVMIYNKNAALELTNMQN